MSQVNDYSFLPFSVIMHVESVFRLRLRAIKILLELGLSSNDNIVETGLTYFVYVHQKLKDTSRHETFLNFKNFPTYIRLVGIISI